jgi:hypothetical protein
VAILFWSSQQLLPGYPLLEARLNASRAARFPYTDNTKPDFVLNLPDYYAFITYSLFCGKVPR